MPELPEIIFATSDPVESRRLGQWQKAGLIRPLVPRAYTSNLTDSLDRIVRRNIWILVSRLFPGVLISHRTAIEHTISPGNNLYLTSSSRRTYRWPGVTLRFAIGHPALEDDHLYYDTLHVSSLERACLENLTTSREVESEKRTIGQDIIERRLMDILQTRGEEALNKLRDNARAIAVVLDMTKAYEKLHLLISALLSTRPHKSLTSPQARAMSVGEPYDSHRIDLFQNLASTLHSWTFGVYVEKTTDRNTFSNFAFYEAYFSNYIEGTTFLIEEARDIVYHKAIIPNRLSDTHDIRGTYALCSNRSEMKKTPISIPSLMEMLRSRHEVLLGGRPEKNPGAFKLKPNKAGDSIFVMSDLVSGTLKEGYAIYNNLQDPVARALFMMFMISEIHPFDDGNGRIARLMMNAELVHAGYTRIIIPTVYRDDYLLALRRLTRKQDPNVYIEMMIRALEFSHWLIPNDLDQMEQQLISANAFLESEEGLLKWDY